MLATALNVPQLRIDAPSTAIVTQWGEVDGRLLRAGDRLVLGGTRDGLVLLVPRGFGRPMLGRHTPRGLVAEPGGVPASASRWGVLSGVRGIERALERGAGMPEGRWSVAVIVEGGATLSLPLSHLREESLSADEVDARLRDALLAARQHGIDVRVGVAADLGEAEALAETAAANHVRISMGVQAAAVEPAGHVIVGPWRGVTDMRPQIPQRQLRLFDLGRRSG
ncbi:MAG: hypothetical protein VX265_08035 [Myxococcota bacterium]|nr:hypothetical protein [Myxococcota bacterium]